MWCIRAAFGFMQYNIYKKPCIYNYSILNHKGIDNILLIGNIASVFVIYFKTNFVFGFCLLIFFFVKERGNECAGYYVKFRDLTSILRYIN